MSSFDTAQVRYIAELAKLDLTEEEIARFGPQLAAILGYFEELSAIDTEHIPPTASVLPLQSVLRADESRPGRERESLLANAAQHEEGMFRVDAILDGGE